ncbi:MAG: response regulator transcription factor [Ignavibacteria bacterium]|nr:response regulator transcription factor [Ignavibacteria bacterium]
MKVLIADDHTIVREGLKKILSSLPEIESVEEAGNGQEVINMVAEAKFDMIILDISMPGKSGLEVLKELKQKNPNLAVLILSVNPEEQYAIRALKSGASGYISKSSASDELVNAVRIIHAGGKYITQNIAEKLVNEIEEDNVKAPHEKLSNREYQVMCMIAAGKSIREIADYLSLSVKTVSVYRVRVLEKLKMRNNSELTYYAIKNKLISS